MTSPADAVAATAGWFTTNDSLIDRPALLAPGQRGLRYRDLDDAISGMTRELATAGIDRSATVATIVPSGLEAALVFLGVSSTAVCAPLNPLLGANELDFYLRDLEAVALAVPSGLDTPARDVAARQRIPLIEIEFNAPAGCVELDVSSLRGAPELIRPAQPDDIALVLHTSGTTGRPKIVPLSHGNLHASAANVAATLRLEPDDRCLNVMPLFHIHGLVAALLASLHAGASVACPPAFRTDAILEWIREFQPTWYTAVPTIHRAILDVARATPQPWPFRFIRSSSAPLAPNDMAALEEVFAVPVIEAYGMTEAADQMTSNLLPPDARRPGSVGIAAGPEVAVTDESGSFVDEGVEGEIVIRGANVMTGYRGTDQDDAFVNGWFRTGDLGTLDRDGYLRITGRRKEMINRGGEKIAPREVDEALLSHPDVTQAVTFAVPHRSLGEDVAAAVVLAPNATVTKGELREEVASQLAPWKVPRQILVCDTLPAGPTGKLQRVGLAALLGVDAAPLPTSPDAPDYVEARDDLERRLSAIVQHVLQLEHPPSVTDDFFGLGADSLHVVQLVAEIERQLDRPFSERALVDDATVESFAAALDHDDVAFHVAEVVPIQPSGDQAPLFCIFRAGSLLAARRIADVLGTTRPVYGISLPAMHGTWRRSGDIVELARRAVDAVRAHRPNGPYCVLGHSLGGLVAYEMADQLIAVGEAVEMLALVDVMHPDFVRRAYPGKFHPRRLGSILKRRGPLALLRALQWPIGSIVRHREYMPGTRAPRDRVATNRRERKYHPRRLDARVALLRIDRPGLPDWLDWTPVVTERWEQHVVPGSHDSMLGDPHVQELATTLAGCLERAR